MKSFQFAHPQRSFAAALGLGILASVPSFAQAPAAEATRLIVQFKPGAASAGRAALAAGGARVALEIHGADAVAALVPNRSLAALQRNPNFALVEEDVKRYPLAVSTPSTAPYASGQQVPYGIKMVQADLLVNQTLPAPQARKVCIIDSGYALGHEDLPSDPGVVSGIHDSGTGDWFVDTNHHGTHVAGTIAALNNAGVGVVGVMPGAALRLHIVKVFDENGWAYSSTLASAANQCKTYGANVISMSLGGGRKSVFEQSTFDSLYNGGILSIAAAGNSGNTTVSYPAGYGSVVSVGAVDDKMAWASFSQYNKDVELVGPGVGVLSTVPMGTGVLSSLTVGAASYESNPLEGSPKSRVSQPLANFGLGDTVAPGSMTGKVCLIQRGTIDFATKVSNCEASGGAGAIIYNNVAGGFSGTLGATVTGIPSVSVSQADGEAMLGQLGQTAAVAVSTSNYAVFEGTSMATPHVSAVAALVWSHYPSTCTASKLRTSLIRSAKDLGPSGRDNKFGYGLVQAKAAFDRIASLGCGN